MSKSQARELKPSQSTLKDTSKRKPIGRRLSASKLLDSGDPLATESKLTYTLSSGREIELTPVQVDAADLAEETYIDPSVNGREQAALTRASVDEICKTIIDQQFFPAIGRRHDDGRIEVIDGSRRRAAALFTQRGLNLLVTTDTLTLEEARALAHSIQTAREHNIREVGLRLKLILESSGLNQKQLALSQGLSAAKVTRALQAASVPTELLSVFPVQADLTYPDYRALKSVVDRLGSESSQLLEVISRVRDETLQIDEETPLDAYKEKIIRLYQRAARAFQARAKPKRDVVNSLWEFADKNVYARKRKRDRSLSFEFNRLPTALQNDLERAVQEVLKTHLSEREQ